ncbi:hypothetical protein PV04_03631 [Phialophora macrospora]|uniref:tyrosinase n=1 Tax=Phialophora macrospora TaxID=1851006 RepID=A0A0D2D206_9EURO|nr:hypothetical protein PV04_03631 [Phialophora macrospora]
MGVLSAEKFAKLKAAQDGFYVIGLQDVTGETGIRRDIDDLALHEKEAFNVFVIALTNLQSTSSANTKNFMSYFQIAGIHGLPLRLWNQEGIKLNARGNSVSGYCHHSHIGFAPWHRPYLALLEQSIFYEMIRVVEKDFQDETYYAGVRRWRLPFWDYYQPLEFYDCGIPDLFTFPKLMIRTSPTGDLVPYDNPLLKFRFPAQNDGGLDQDDWKTLSWATYSKTETTRYPSTMKERTLQEAYNHLVTRKKEGLVPLGKGQDQDIALNKAREQALKHLIVMFKDNSYTDMTAFGTNAKVEGVSGSLEGTIHGAYHSWIGHDGHMGIVPVAAFDPVFWMHHCQIDRLFAIWQKINPNSWFPTDPNKIKELGQVYFNPEVPLEPFRSAKHGEVGTLGKNGWWTCNTARSTKMFGYSYADVDAADALDNFNKKYGWSVRWKEGDKFGECPSDMRPLNMTIAQVFQFSQTDGVSQPSAQKAIKADVVPSERAISGEPTDSVPLVSQSDVEESTVSRSWYIDMEVERLALNGSFDIHYFTGPFGGDPTKYLIEKELAGVTNVFTAPIEACDNCGRNLEQALLVTGTTDITPILLDYIKIGQLQSLDASDVVAFLKNGLKWRVVTAEKQVIDPRTIESLKLGVSSRIAPLPPWEGEIRYQNFPEVIEHIISNAA